jgi:hypothetical protein
MLQNEDDEEFKMQFEDPNKLEEEFESRVTNIVF